MIVLGIVSLLVTQTQAKPIPPIEVNNLAYQERVKKMADGWRSRFGIPGVWCACIRDGKVVAYLANGYRNLEKGEAARIEDYLAVASVSKPITGTMIAHFVAEGAISYDTKVRDVFPERAKAYPNSPLLNATLGMFLAHTSGLQPLMERPRLTGKDFRLKELDNALSDPSTRAPGQEYAYAMGANIAVAMVEKCTATRFEDWLSSPVASDIGLLDAGQRMEDAIDPVTTYWLEGGTPKSVGRWTIKSFDAAGSFYLKLRDLCNFTRLTMEGTLPYSSDLQYKITHRTEPVKSCDTLASWHVSSQGQVFHQGHWGGRGEFAGE